MLPQLNRIRKNTTNISVFRGLNRSVNVGFSRVSANNSSIFTEFSDMENLSSDKFPMLTQRKPRARSCTELNATSNLLSTNGRFIYIDSGDTLHYGEKTINITHNDKIKHRYIYLYGNRVIIMPDRVMYTLGDDEVEELAERYSCHMISAPTYDKSGKTDGLGYSKCSIQKIYFNDGEEPQDTKGFFAEYINFADAGSQISASANLSRLFEDINLEDTVEDIYSSPSILWRVTREKTGKDYDKYVEGKLRVFTKVNQYYIKMSFYSNERECNIKKGDYIKLSNFTRKNIIPYTEEATDKYPCNKDFIDTLNTSFFKVYDIRKKNENGVYYTDIVIKHDLNASIPYKCDGSETERPYVEVKRLIPALENNLLIECNNRLWGCSSESNEIYSSKLGDASNWYAFGDGISTDSYAATIGCEGDFTGIARQNDSVIFFKENHIIKLYGTKPSNFTLATYDMQGVEKGSENSLVWINGVLYYKGKDGICAYQSGGAPVVISEDAFGDKKYKNCVAGRYKNKYVVSCEDESGGHELFIYDTEKGLWHKEDNTNIISCTTYNNRLYYIDGDTGFLYSFDDGGELLKDSGNTENEAEFAWYAQTGDLYDGDLFMKHISRLRIGIKPEKGARIRVLAKFSEFGQWCELSRLHFHDKRPDVIPVAIRRSQFLKLKIEGFGKADIYAIDIEYAQGSDKR